MQCSSALDRDLVRSGLRVDTPDNTSLSGIVTVFTACGSRPAELNNAMPVSHISSGKRCVALTPKGEKSRVEKGLPKRNKGDCQPIVGKILEVSATHVDVAAA